MARQFFQRVAYKWNVYGAPLVMPFQIPNVRDTTCASDACADASPHPHTIPSEACDGLVDRRRDPGSERPDG